MLALCRLWNAARFFSPDLVDESDERWDDALVAAIPKVDADPRALGAAAAAMLATLQDPYTAPLATDRSAPVVAPHAELRDGVRIVSAGAPDGDADDTVYAAALAPLVRLGATDRAIVIDLRAGAMPSFDQRYTMDAAWKKVALAAGIVTAAVVVPQLEHRYLMGFPPEAVGTDGIYTDGRESEGVRHLVVPALGARDVPIAYVVDETSQIPIDAVTLAVAGRAAIFAARPDAVAGPGRVTAVDAGDGLKVAFRTSAVSGGIPVRRGGLDDAIAWTAARVPRDRGSVPAQHISTPLAVRYGAAALPDDAHRVLAAFRIWGTIAYAWPYRDRMQDDWDAALTAALNDLRSVGSPVEYDLALRKMYAHTHDSHGYIGDAAATAAYGGSPAFRARDVEGRLTIVRVDPTIAQREGFAVGDVIERIDGATPAALRSRWLPYVVASTPQSAADQLTFGRAPGLLSGPVGTATALTLRSADGRVRIVRATRHPLMGALFLRTRPITDVLPGGIGYIDLARLTVAEVEPALRRLASTRAVVLDLRGYPEMTYASLAAHFASVPVRAALTRTPVRRDPIPAPGADRASGVEYVDETRAAYTVVNPQAPRYARPVVVVIDVSAISRSEHAALYMRAAAKARFVGEPSVGADGEATSMRVPGAVMLNFSGQEVLHPDGTPLQRVGIIPDVPVSPTLAGIRAGDDELLAAAVQEALRESGASRSAVASSVARERALERADAAAQRRPSAP
jgi:C-terminal processing protease CtpA/Prc